MTDRIEDFEIKFGIPLDEALASPETHDSEFVACDPDRIAAFFEREGRTQVVIAKNLITGEESAEFVTYCKEWIGNPELFKRDMEWIQGGREFAGYRKEPV